MTSFSVRRPARVALSGSVDASGDVEAIDQPSWLSALAINQWGEISGTNLSTAGVRQSQFERGGGEDPIDGWGGWAVNGKTLYLTGGGHSNGPDNAMYGITLSSNTPTWSRVADGSATSDWVRYHRVAGVEYYANYNLDGKPTAAHIYHMMGYAGGKVVRWRFYQDYGATLTTAMAIAPNGEGWTNLLDPTTGVWTLGALAPSYTMSDLSGSGNPAFRNGVVSDGTLIYALWRNRVYGSDVVQLMTYNPATDTYTVAGPDLGTVPDTGFGGCLFDTTRNEMVMIPENGTNLQRINLSTGARTQTALTGAQANFSIGWDSSYMGACYDSTRDLYYVYAGQTSTGKLLYQINPNSSYACTTVSVTGTPTTTSVAGVNNRMVYWADWDVIVMQPAWNSGLWALKRS